MGVAISTLLEGSEVTLDQLAGKVIAIDAMNMLYQFVTTIRGHDGTPLKDSHGNITSHLTGLFSRCTRLMEKGLRLVFVFDGQMPELKAKERERREKLKEQAATQYAEAESSKDVETMKKLAGRSARLSSEMIRQSKELLTALGIPVVEAPSEGEAQAAFMVREGDCDFVASQDIDCLIYGAPRVVRNLSLSQKRKKINALTYKTILPQTLELDDVLAELEIGQDQLIALAMLVGTDFNVGGIKGLGPKKSLALVQKFKDDLPALFEEVKFDDECGVSWQEVFDTIKHIPTTKDYELNWTKVDEESVENLLILNHDFSKERVANALSSLAKAQKKSQQSSLNKFF